MSKTFCSAINLSVLPCPYLLAVVTFENQRGAHSLVIYLRRGERGPMIHGVQ